MVIKIGIDQITRSHFQWTPYNENWVSANYVSPGEPIQKQKLPNSQKKFNYGFNDFIIAELTPEIATQIKGQFESDVVLPPDHVRAYKRKTAEPVSSTGMEMFGFGAGVANLIGGKHRAGYTRWHMGGARHPKCLTKPAKRISTATWKVLSQVT